VRVTTLNDGGRGSLREALRHGNRTVVFDVAGEIRLSTHLYVGGPFVTIDGSSAPPPGITLRGHGLIIRGNRGAHDVIVRGLRVRDAAIDGIQIAYGAYNVVIDHVSVAGSADGNIDITAGSRDVTVSWSIIGNNKKSMLIKYNPSRITLHHNVLVGSLERNPQVRIDDTERGTATDTTADIRNNLVANWHSGQGALIWYGPWANVVNNVFASGKQRGALRVESARAYVAGNVFTDEIDVNRLGTESAAFPAPAVDTQDACAAAQLTLAGAGVRPLDALDHQLLASIAVPLCPAIPAVASAAAPGLVVTPRSVTFRAVEKAAQPLRETLAIGTEGPPGIAWTATVSIADGPRWLAVTPAAGLAPGQLVIEASVEGLASGTYPATVTIAERGVHAAALSIPVELVVGPASPGEGAGGRGP
jgi:pectate lyase